MKKRFIYMVAHDMEADGTHPLYRNPLTAWLGKSVFRYADCVVVQNEYEKEQLLRSHPGLAVVIFKKPIEEKLYQLEAEKKYDGIWVGRCDDWKEPEAFLLMCKALPESSFVMIAPPATGKLAYFEKIKSMAAELSNVSFYDFLPNIEVRVKLAESRIFCMTSTQEGDWPMVVLEATASGLPIVSLHVNYDGLIDECGGGIYCNDDADTLAMSMTRLCSDDDLYTSMSNGARTYISHFHAIDTQMEKFKKLLRDM
jgi:glycosyltransferase involved in cell wall biosynthesis